MIDTPFFSGGNTELTAGLINALTHQLSRAGRLAAAPPLEVVQQGEGWLLRLAEGRRGLWARLEGEPASGRYGWVQQSLSRDGFRDAEGGLSGGVRPGDERQVAWERNGVTGVEDGSIAWLEPGTGGEDEPPWWFFAPAAPGAEADVFWAMIDGESGGTYGWAEAELGADGAFRAMPGGRTAVAGGDAAAVEANGSTAVPDGAVVLLWPGDAGTGGDGRAAEAEGGRARWAFAHSTGTAGFWARLARGGVDAVWTLSLGGATGGAFTLSFSEEDGAGSPGGTTEALASDVDAEGLQEAVDAVAGAGNAVVDGGGGSFTITMAGALRGDAAHSWTLAAGSLEGADGAAAELSTTGRSLPFTDGRGRYSWVKLAADASGVLRDDPASGGSRWPLGLARDSNGRADCPEGLLVWMRPGVTAYADAEEVEGDDAFAGWEEEEVAEHLDGLLDGASGLYADALCDFAAWGEHAFWAELTGPPVGGLYPFRAVHLGDAPPGEAAVPELGEGEDFPEGYADGLGAALVSGGTPGDGTFRDALADGQDDADGTAGGRPLLWAGSRPAGRPVTGVAREIAARAGLEGAVVLVHPRTGEDGTVAFAFAGPPAGLWATVVAHGGGGTYSWEELAPPLDTLAGGRAEARTGQAQEAGGCEEVPEGAAVWLELDSAATASYRFRWRHQGTEVRLGRYVGGGMAELDPNATAPEANSGTVAVTQWPPYRPALLEVGGYYPLFRQPGGGYVICQPLDYASDRQPGLISDEDQALPAIVDFSRRLHVGPAAASGGLARPLVAVFNAAGPSFTTFAAGQTAFYDDGGRPVVEQSHGGAAFRLLSGSFDVTGDCYSFGGSLSSGGTGSQPDQFREIGFSATLTWLDGYTGTIRVPGPAEGYTDIEFLGGLYRASASVAPAALFTGTFVMDRNGSVGGTGTVTVVDGVITDFS